MKIFLSWLFGCILFGVLVRRFTRLRGGVAVGVTILAGSLPIWIVLFPIMGSFVDGNVGAFGAVLLLGLAGGLLVALGLLVLLLGALGSLFGEGKKKGNDAVGASRPERAGVGTSRAEQDGFDEDVRCGSEGNE